MFEVSIETKVALALNVILWAILVITFTPWVVPVPVICAVLLGLALASEG